MYISYIVKSILTSVECPPPLPVSCYMCLNEVIQLINSHEVLLLLPLLSYHRVLSHLADPVRVNNERIILTDNFPIA